MEAGKTAVYIGETHRAWIDRLQEHTKAIRGMDATYATVSHHKEHHPGLPCNFSFKILKVHKSSLERQLSEALSIANTHCDILMNKKGEWGINLVPTMGTMVMGGMGDWGLEDNQAQNVHLSTPEPGNREHAVENLDMELTLRERKRRRKCPSERPITTTSSISVIDVQSQRGRPGLTPGGVAQV